MANPFSLLYIIMSFLLIASSFYLHHIRLSSSRSIINASAEHLELDENEDPTSKGVLLLSIILGVIGTLPILAIKLGVTYSFALFFGGTTSLIIITVILDLVDKISNPAKNE